MAWLLMKFELKTRIVTACQGPPVGFHKPAPDPAGVDPFAIVALSRSKV